MRHINLNHVPVYDDRRVFGGVPDYVKDGQTKRRSEPTPQEKMVAEMLSRYGIEYVREQIFEGDLGRYIVVDFYIPRARMIVEVDGGQHFSDGRRSLDRRRDMRNAARGLVTLRVPNNLASDPSTHRLIAQTYNVCRDAISAGVWLPYRVFYASRPETLYKLAEDLKRKLRKRGKVFFRMR